MEITLKIEGMMCPHCENRVKTSLENLPGVTKADVSHKTGTAIVTADETVSEQTLIDIVVNAGYKVL